MAENTTKLYNTDLWKKRLHPFHNPYKVEEGYFKDKDADFVAYYLRAILNFTESFESFEQGFNPAYIQYNSKEESRFIIIMYSDYYRVEDMLQIMKVCGYSKTKEIVEDKEYIRYIFERK